MSAVTPHRLHAAVGAGLTALVGGARRLLKTPLGALGLFLVALVVFAAMFADVIAPYDPLAINVPARLVPPNWDHWLGTDQLGRDLFSRMLKGAQIALTVTVTSITISLGVGLVLGLAAGYGPRWLDQGAVLLFDTVRSFPTIMFALAVVALTGPSLQTIILIIVITTFPVYGRVVRTQTQAIRNNEFVLAERSMGAGPLRVLGVHILPNIIGPLLIMASMDVPIVITIEAGLSFLGLGVRPPTPSWGSMLNDGYSFIRNSSWPVIAGGVPLILTTLGFTFLGESLRDVFDPKLRRDV
ncbi:MAG: ABC transporter permease [Gammaproteobacteria bacterium]